MTYTFHWDRAPLDRLVRVALARALARMVMHLVGAIKAGAPVGRDKGAHKAGTLQRSIRSAPPDYAGADYAEALGRDLAETDIAAVVAQMRGLAISIGSWVYYAWWVHQGLKSVPNYPKQPYVHVVVDGLRGAGLWQMYVTEELARARAELAAA